MPSFPARVARGTRPSQWGWRLFVFALCAIAFAASLAGAAPTTELSADPTAGWRIEPLGPDGADISTLIPYSDSQWLACSRRGAFLSWQPSPPQALVGGAWEEIPLSEDAAVLRMQKGPLTEGEATVLVLTASGELLAWIPDHLREADLPESLWLRAQLPPDVADDIVALLPVRDPIAGHLLLIDRRGFAHRVDGQGYRDDPVKRPDPEETESEPRLVRVRAAFVHPSAPDLIVVVSEWEGLLASRDGARTLAPLHGGLPKAIRAACPLPDGGLCAVGPEGTFVSRNLGRTWVQTGHLPGGNGEICEILADPEVSGRLYAITHTGRLVRSVDDGATWELLLADIPVRARDLAFDAHRGELIVATSRGVLGSLDGGLSWEWHNRGLRRVSVLSIGVADEGETLLLGTDLGLYTSLTRGQLWFPTLPGMGSWAQSSSRPSHGTSLVEMPDAPVACASLEAWRRLSGAISAVDVVKGNAGRQLLCAAGEDGLVYCWTSGEAESPETVWEAPAPARSATSVLALPSGEGWASGRRSERLWVEEMERSGESRVGAWSGTWPDILPLPEGREALSAAWAGERIWLGTDDGLYRADALGEWTLAGFEQQRVINVLVAAERSGSLLCWTDQGISWSTDAGQSWREVSVPAEIQVISLGLDPTGERVYLGTRQGLFAAEPRELEARIRRTLPVEAFPNPFGRQVWMRCNLRSPAALLPGDEVATMGMSETDASVPADATDAPSLEQELLEAVAAEDPEIRIISVHGQVVCRLSGAELVSDLDGGAHLQWVWDGRDAAGQEAPNGIYLVSTRVGKQSFRGKIVKFR
jgi:photosystem II stability/assembly factor-like uncharacterized protein